MGDFRGLLKTQFYRDANTPEQYPAYVTASFRHSAHTPYVQCYKLSSAHIRKRREDIGLARRFALLLSAYLLPDPR